MKSIFIALLLNVMPIAANAFVEMSICISTEIQNKIDCENIAGCAWRMGRCTRCANGTYNNGDGNGCVRCEGPYNQSPTGATSQNECFMECGPNTTKEPNGSWEPDKKQIYPDSPEQQCTYDLPAGLTCNSNFHKENVSCITNTMPCGNFITRYCEGKLTENNTTYKIQNTDTYCQRTDKYLHNYSVGNAKYNTNATNKDPDWDVNGCVGLSFPSANGGTTNIYPCVFSTEIIGQGYLAMTEYKTIVDGGTRRNVCNAVHVATRPEISNQSIWSDVATTGYYYGDKVKTSGLFSPCPMGTTSDIGATSITDCHTTAATRFVDSNGNSFSIEDLFGKDSNDKIIQLNVVAQ